MRKLPAIFLLLLISCNMSSNNETTPPQAQRQRDSGSAGVRTSQPSPSNPASTSARSGSYVQFRKVTVEDQEVVKGPAFTALIPQDWTHDAKVFWQLDNAAYPANGYFRAGSQEGVAYDGFPSLYFTWTNDPMFHNGFPVGARYMGHVVRSNPPREFFDELLNQVIQPTRSQTTNLRVLQRKPLPELSAMHLKSLGQLQGARMTADAGMIRVSYNYNGRAYEEEFYGLGDSMTFQIQNYTGAYNTTISWKLSGVRSFRAPAGTLEQHRKVWEFINQSLRYDLGWYSGMMQVMQILHNKQMQSIRNAGEISRMISRNNDAMIDSIRQNYRSTQESYERVNNNFDQYIRGVEDYSDSSGNTYELPSGYSKTYVNRTNDTYILSDEPNFVPPREWEELQRRQ